METYTFLKGRQDNKWCSLKKFDFFKHDKKSGTEGVFIVTLVYKLFVIKFVSLVLSGIFNRDI